MKEILCCLLIAVLILGTFAGCKGKNPLPTESTGATQTENTETTQTTTEETKTESKEEDSYAYSMDDEVATAMNNRAYSDSYLTFTFPLDWEYSVVQGEDGRNYYFKDPVLGDQCQFSFRITGSIYAKELTKDYYQEAYSHLYEDFAIDTFTKETIQGLQCTKMGYSYTDDGTKLAAVLYTNVVDGARLYNFSITYPANQKETYEPIFADIMDSIRIKPIDKKDISTLPLTEAYAQATKAYADNPQGHRDIGELQPETSQIVEIDGKYYQSYVTSNVDIRYIWISQPEFPDESQALWDWYTVGTAEVYSLELLGQMDKGGR